MTSRQLSLRGKHRSFPPDPTPFRFDKRTKAFKALCDRNGKTFNFLCNERDEKEELAKTLLLSTGSHELSSKIEPARHSSDAAMQLVKKELAYLDAKISDETRSRDEEKTKLTAEVKTTDALAEDLNSKIEAMNEEAEDREVSSGKTKVSILTNIYF